MSQLLELCMERGGEWEKGRGGEDDIVGLGHILVVKKAEC